MDRQVALAKLRKILGKSFGYQIDPKAPKADERAEAQSLLPCAIADRKTIADRLEARRAALLAADPEYRSLKIDYDERRRYVDELLSKTNHYKITVGTSSALFFRVEAQGDTWEDVLEILKSKQRAA